MSLPLKTKRPPWLKAKIPSGSNYTRLKGLVTDLRLHTVCESALCPNLGECWERGTATFMILGDVCTRSCGFCAVTSGKPMGLDMLEPLRVAKAIEDLGLKHAVVTSVNRDDLEDGGSEIFAQTIVKIKERCPNCTIEVLIPDFRGMQEPLKRVMEAKPDILNHNTETVPRLYKRVRPGARYDRSLELLANAKEINPYGITKTGLMLGLGEERDEVLAVMSDLVKINCDIMTLGQYLRPSKDHLPIERYIPPEEFAELKRQGEAMGLQHVEAGPLVRSSYHADDQVDMLKVFNGEKIN